MGKRIFKDRVIKMHIAVLFVLLICFVALHFYANYLSQIEHCINMGWDDGEYYFNFENSKQWSETAHGYVNGLEYDGYIENRTEDVLTNWRIEAKLPNSCRIDSYWNGEFEMDEDGRLVVTSLDFNDTIDPGEVQGVGFILHSQILDNLSDVRFYFTKDVKVYNLPAFIPVMAFFVMIIVTLIVQISIDIKTEKLLKKQAEQKHIIDQSFLTFARMIDAKDAYTKGHSQRVAIYSRELARRMGLPEEEQERIFYIALLHDIGKIGVTDAILKKSAKLTYDEFNQVKEHTSMGGDILKNFNAIEGIEKGARYHHERYDGKGYMEGLSGEDIPLVARIIGVADAFDAMSSNRCYRNAFEMDHILEELRECSGKQFDPFIVPHMIGMVDCGFAPISDEDMEDLEKVLSSDYFRGFTKQR